MKEEILKAIEISKFKPTSIILSSQNEYIGRSINGIPIEYHNALPKDEYLIKS